MSRRGGYNSLRDRYKSSIGGAPIGFVKSGPFEYRSRDGLWTIKHRYKAGYQAHHEWHVHGPDGKIWTRRRGGVFGSNYYLTLGDAVEDLNEAVAAGPVGMLSNFLARLREQDAERAKREREAAECAATIGSYYERIEAWIVANGIDALTRSAGRRSLAEFLASGAKSVPDTRPTLGELLRSNTDEHGNIGPIPAGEIARAR